MATVAFHTLGCKVNSYETEAIRELFIKEGYDCVSFKDISDVYVINTCTVTNTGDAKSRQMIRRAKRLNKDAIICVVGCYAQMSSQDVSLIDGVNVIIGTTNRDHIIDDIKKYKETHTQVIDVVDIHKEKEFESMVITSFDTKTRAFMKIQDGCNNFCTYCIIPYARGRMRSRLPEDVLHQAETLVNAGYKEIVLTGIHTAGYGEDFDNYSFSDLLQDLIQIKGLERLRISSIEMSQVTDSIITLITENNAIVDHLHIPIQSGCNKILKRMHRHYTRQEYEEKLHRIKQLLPDISITTDVIVGFPGETEEDFNDTYEWIKKNEFVQLHVFPYSPRTGTPAATYKDQIPGNIKQERVRKLMDLSHELYDNYARRFIGNSYPVLFEDEHTGHMTNYLKVQVEKDMKPGTIINITIKELDNHLLIGDINEKD